jgi:hypothetical protein
VREVAADRMVTDPDRPSPADAVLFGHRHLRLDTSSLSAGPEHTEPVGVRRRAPPRACRSPPRTAPGPRRR